MKMEKSPEIAKTNGNINEPVRGVLFKHKEKTYIFQ